MARRATAECMRTRTLQRARPKILHHCYTSNLTESPAKPPMIALTTNPNIHMGKSVITGPLISDLLGGSGRFTLCDAAGRAQDRRAVWRQSRYGAAPAVCSDSACGRSGAGRSPGSPMVWNRNRTLLLDRPAQLRRALAGCRFRKLRFVHIDGVARQGSVAR
jgi:hypothetical protein